MMSADPIEPQSRDLNGPTWQKQITSRGEFLRGDARFRSWISKNPTAEFAPDPNRYHLYVSHACPWAHRTMIVRGLKGLSAVVSHDVVDWLLPKTGWTLLAKTPGATRDSVSGEESLRAIYEKCSPEYRGAVTVPVLWDKQRGVIVNNESSEIIRMLNSEFNAVAQHPEVDLYPTASAREIDATNEWIYSQINNGVYRCGFARSQEAYDSAVALLFDGLDRAEKILSERRYLTGGRLTEADVRLFTTLIRFDIVYVAHFRCNVRRLVEYPHLWGYTRELYAHPVFRNSTDFVHIKHHYFESHESINPYRIVPRGPLLDYDAPHGREHLPAEWFPSVV